MDNENELPEEPNGPNGDHPERVPSEEELSSVVFGVSASEIEAANRTFREGLIPAAQSIVHVAQYSKNDRLRLDASKYVVERNLGRVVDHGAAEKKDKLAELLETITKPSEG